MQVLIISVYKIEKKKPAEGSLRFKVLGVGGLGCRRSGFRFSYSKFGVRGVRV